MSPTKSGKTMATDNKKTKPDTSPKDSNAAKVESPAAKDAKPEDGQTAAAAPSNYSRGEGQKPVSAAYRENWNAIFRKKKNVTKKKR
jgi:hypothetical protein